MSETQFSRTEGLIGKAAVEKLHRARVALFGVGGVGGYVAEALVRSGVGTIDLFDGDTVQLTNLNRQIVALHSTLGEYKAEAMARRLKDINPAVQASANVLFYLPENADEVDLSVYDYVVDAVDTVAAKTELAARCLNAGIKIISAMGAGNKLDPLAFRVGDISQTSVCPLARAMRRELKKRGVERGLKCVYSAEPPVCADKERLPKSAAHMPSVMGLIIAAEVIKDLTEEQR
ncbi:MAG: tRNA threonylcarbamoyladenosine dehydratase [Bacillota bacterium]|nr:MAG: tRNA threonylcarbamoyladenosine dehydratase [Bacillota bacterium]